MGQQPKPTDANADHDAPRLAALRALGLHVIVADMAATGPLGQPASRIVEDLACIPHAYACATDAFIAMNEILSKGHVEGRRALRVMGPAGDETPQAISYLEQAGAAARA